uniref:PH domain-containing protein n=1 Tax=Hippocampus comes TaxID=109280 RepID=A0A3Q2XKU4_HIPCM
IIAAVDLTVSKYERSQELQEVLARLENKSFAKLKSGKVIRKQDLHSKHRDLQHKGLLYWKTATGRLKDTLALLLTDVLVFLQEKDQRFVFAAVDQKPPVIPLQKLIVREVANEERGMFLISASSAGPEMYEVHTTTREERNAWMRHIRQAVESCPEEEEEEERSAESEEAKRAAEAKVQKISKFQETLLNQDQRICNSLEEKLQLYAELTELTLRSSEAVPHRHLLVQPDIDSESPRPASTLLTAALREALGQGMCGQGETTGWSHYLGGFAVMEDHGNRQRFESSKLESGITGLYDGNVRYCVQTEQENALERREQHCILEAQRLRCEREELEAQLLEYRNNLDRLREGQKSVDREKEKLEAQQRVLQSWRHNRQSSLPVTIPLDGYKILSSASEDALKHLYRLTLFFSNSLSDFSPQLDRHSPGVWRPGHELYKNSFSPASSPSLTPLLPPQSYLSLEGHLREDGSEENIVYL